MYCAFFFYVKNPAHHFWIRVSALLLLKHFTHATEYFVSSTHLVNERRTLGSGLAKCRLPFLSTLGDFWRPPSALCLAVVAIIPLTYKWCFVLHFSHIKANRLWSFWCYLLFILDKIELKISGLFLRYNIKSKSLRPAKTQWIIAMIYMEQLISFPSFLFFINCNCFQFHVSIESLFECFQFPISHFHW